MEPGRRPGAAFRRGGWHAMGYRSIRRVLGETSLERKCRVLFGLSLLVLIGGTFWWVDRVAERLVLQTTRRHARDQVHVILVSSHADVWETRDPNAKEVLKEAVEELVGERSYRYEIITRDLRYQLTHLGHVTTPRGPDEAELLARLEALWQQRQAEKGRTEGAAAAAEGGTVEPVFADRRFPENNEYHYYAPIEWSATCRHCHLDLREAGGVVDSGGRPGLRPAPHVRHQSDHAVQGDGAGHSSGPGHPDHRRHPLRLPLHGGPVCHRPLCHRQATETPA